MAPNEHRQLGLRTAAPGIIQIEKGKVLNFRIKNKRDLIGGCVIALFGLVSVIEGSRLGVGTLVAMGPGYVPLSLGLLLIFLGSLMAVRQTEPVEGTGVIL